MGTYTVLPWGTGEWAIVREDVTDGTVLLRLLDEQAALEGAAELQSGELEELRELYRRRRQLLQPRRLARMSRTIARSIRLVSRQQCRLSPCKETSL